MTPDEQTEAKRRQKARNLVVAGTLLFFVVLFYAITIARLGSQ